MDIYFDMKRNLLLPLFAVCALSVQAQDVVVVNESQVVTINDDGKGFTTDYSVTYQLNNEKAEDYANFSEGMDIDETLSDFSGQIVKDGVVLRKIRMKDVQRSEYTQSLADDSYVLFTDITPPSYPVQVTYHYKITSKHLLALPKFLPMSDFDMKVLHATYQLIVPKGVNILRHEENLQKKPVVTTDEKGRTVYSFEVENLGEIHDQPYLALYDMKLPKVMFAPEQFFYKGHSGSLKSWKDMGLWEYQLNDLRQQLPSAAIAQVHAVADTCKDNRSKIAALYKLMGSMTHYVSIQLGIGGYQAMAASDVWNRGYGDCKALSNFMKAMLAEVGIKSNLLAINSGGRKQLCHDLANFQQMNHMILEVPMEKDTCWLECTNTDVPVGYIHSDIVGHDALELSEQGGKLVTLPEYADSMDLDVRTADIQLAADGTAEITVVDDRRNGSYEDDMRLLHLSEKDRNDAINADYSIAQSEIVKVELEDRKIPFQDPHLISRMQIHSEGYADVMGSRLFVPLNPVRADFSVPLIDSTRQEAFRFPCGYVQKDIVTLHIPEGYEIEAQPKGMLVSFPFGRVTALMVRKDNDLVFTFIREHKRGVYPASHAKDMMKYFNLINYYHGQRLVLKKK